MVFSQNPCCISAGLVPSSFHKNPSRAPTDPQGYHMFYLQYFGKGDESVKDSHTGAACNSNPIRIGIYVDMDIGEMVIFRQEIGQSPKFAQRF
jgi:hypothetical protein